MNYEWDEMDLLVRPCTAVTSARAVRSPVHYNLKMPSNLDIIVNHLVSNLSSWSSWPLVVYSQTDAQVHNQSRIR